MDRPKFFTPAEVAAHNTAADLWVSFLGKVCDLTPLMNQHKGERQTRGEIRRTVEESCRYSGLSSSKLLFLLLLFIS